MHISIERSVVRRLPLTVVASMAVLEAVACGPTEEESTGAIGEAILSAVGPVNPADGFPTSYTDGNGLTLTRCLDPLNPLCGLAAGDVPNPSAPVLFPTNYPDESFYMSATSTMALGKGNKALLVLTLESAFANGPVVPGDQIVFSRIRIRVDSVKQGAIYRVTHPYGVDMVSSSTSGRRGINFTLDLGLVPGAFATALTGRVGPFLTWDPPASAPPGFLGNPAVTHKITGSAFGTNVFRIEGPDIGVPGSPLLCNPKAAKPLDCVQTDQFTLFGKKL